MFKRFKSALLTSKKQTVSTVIISLIMAVLYFVCIHFRDFNTITGMYASLETALKYVLKIIVLAVILFAFSYFTFISLPRNINDLNQWIEDLEDF